MSELIAKRRMPNLNFWQIMNMSVGFFGIQHGFEIQFARMSSVYEKLGASGSDIPFLWLAAPLTGLIVQPIIGYMSDKTWISALKMRRRPYFFIGALFGTIALFIMPNAGSLWMAVGMLWILDTSLNISMEPFRAFVADKLNTEQRPRGFAFQSLMIGLGTIVGNWIASTDFLTIYPSLSAYAPSSMHLSFYFCAAIMFCSVLYTIVTTPEYPPDQASQAKKSQVGMNETLRKWWAETSECYLNMPPVMRRVAAVQFFTWMGLFCMWMFYTIAVAHNTFGATDPNSPLYDEGIRWGAHTMMIKGLFTPIFAIVMPYLVVWIGRSYTHALTLFACGIGLLMMPFIHTPSLLYIPMMLAGIAWASIVALPYVIISEHIPEGKFGIYMGIFNAFIVLPEILVSLGLGTLIMKMLDNDYAWAVAAGGIMMLIASIIMLSVHKLDKD